MKCCRLGFWLHIEAAPLSRTPLVCRRHFLRPLEARSSAGHRMLLERERNYGFGMDAPVAVCFWNASGFTLWAWMLWSRYAPGTRTELCFGHRCSGHCVLLEHEWNYALGMKARVTVCSWNTNGIMLWAWMLWSPYTLGTRTALRTELCFGHGRSGHRILLEHERISALGMDALAIICTTVRFEHSPNFHAPQQDLPAKLTAIRGHRRYYSYCYYYYYYYYHYYYFYYYYHYYYDDYS